MMSTQRSSIFVEKLRKLPPTFGSTMSFTVSSEMVIGLFIRGGVTAGCMR
jgi:hypothetical protein